MAKVLVECDGCEEEFEIEQEDLDSGEDGDPIICPDCEESLDEGDVEDDEY